MLTFKPESLNYVKIMDPIENKISEPSFWKDVCTFKMLYIV